MVIQFSPLFPAKAGTQGFMHRACGSGSRPSPGRAGLLFSVQIKRLML